MPWITTKLDSESVKAARRTDDLLHDNPVVAATQRYIGIEPQRIEQAIQNHAQLL